MSLSVAHLFKTYDAQQALKGISFEVPRGQIAGFLGPNGAGKSTTMKILTGYIPPGQGNALVCGIDITVNPIEARKKIGYLPEHNPLYMDMYVPEFLLFTGKLFGMSGKMLRSRVEEMIEMCGLLLERHKRIEALSKGYRQRVGLAQALLHNPEVLILDEPTSGLDPNQLIEIRKLIKEISKEKTVLFSTHIMQEVQALCDRVILINQGSIVADASLNELLSSGLGSSSLLAEFAELIDVSMFESIVGIIQVHHLGGFQYRIVFEQGADVRSEVFKLAAAKQITLLGLRLEEQSLESVFASLTGKEASA